MLFSKNEIQQNYVVGSIGESYTKPGHAYCISLSILHYNNIILVKQLGKLACNYVGYSCFAPTSLQRSKDADYLSFDDA